MTDTEQRELWLQFRRALLLMVHAIEDKYTLAGPQEPTLTRR